LGGYRLTLHQLLAPGGLDVLHLLLRALARIGAGAPLNASETV